MAQNSDITKDSLRSILNPLLNSNSLQNSFKLKDINYSSSNVPIAEYPHNIDIDGKPVNNVETPKIIVAEFQPDFQSNVWETLEDGLDIVKSTIGGISRTISKAVKQTNGEEDSSNDTTNPNIRPKRLDPNMFLTSIIDSGSGKGKLSTKALIDIPINNLYKILFAGKYVANFDIPYYGDNYLHPNGSAGWTNEGLEKKLGDTVAKHAATIQKFLPLNVPGIPKWEMSDNYPDAVSSSFLLYNDTLDNLIKNFKYVNALSAGAFFSYLGVFLKSPNVYHIHCPGRFNYYFCTGDIQIDYVGKTRRLNRNGITKFRNNTNVSDDIVYGFFPDGYKVTVNFTSLIPNMYNNYIDYIINGSDLKSDKIVYPFNGIIKESSKLSNTLMPSIGGTTRILARPEPAPNDNI